MNSALGRKVTVWSRGTFGHPQNRDLTSNQGPSPYMPWPSPYIESLSFSFSKCPTSYLFMQRNVNDCSSYWTGQVCFTGISGEGGNVTYCAKKTRIIDGSFGRNQFVF